MREGSGELPKGTQEGRVEDMFDILDMERSIEILIGTRFYFRNHLYEVAEFEEGKQGCIQCAFYKRGNEAICEVMKCNLPRHDDKYIRFLEVKETEEKNNG